MRPSPPSESRIGPLVVLDAEDDPTVRGPEMVGQHASQTRIVMVVRGRLMGGRIEHEDMTGTGAEDVSVAAVESGDLYAAFGHGGFSLVPGERAARQRSADRKRVVWGKSVVDSVDIGGCRQY